MKNLKLLNNFVFQILLFFLFSIQSFAIESVDIWKSYDELQDVTQDSDVIDENKKNLLLENNEIKSTSISVYRMYLCIPLIIIYVPF